jgi:uncharacterized protein
LTFMEYKINSQQVEGAVWLQIKHGEDLLKKVSYFCSENGINSAYVSAIGALQKANVGYYDQMEKKYLENKIDGPLEIVSLTGNLSLREGKPFLHAHICLADREGKVFGGHLNEGNTVFACECLILKLKGNPLERKFDSLTGLSLWDFS